MYSLVKAGLWAATLHGRSVMTSLYDEGTSGLGTGLWRGWCCRTRASVTVFFFFSSRRRHTRSDRDWSSDVCSSDLSSDRATRLVAVPEDGDHVTPLPAATKMEPAQERRHERPHTVHGPRFFALSKRMGAVVAAVSVLGISAGIFGVLFGQSTDLVGLIAVVLLVGAGQALALEYDEAEGSISVSAVGALAGAALFGPRAALPLAVTISLVEWSARRPAMYQVVFNI